MFFYFFRQQQENNQFYPSCTKTLIETGPFRIEQRIGEEHLMKLSPLIAICCAITGSHMVFAESRQPVYRADQYRAPNPSHQSGVAPIEPSNQRPVYQGGYGQPYGYVPQGTIAAPASRENEDSERTWTMSPQRMFHTIPGPMQRMFRPTESGRERDRYQEGYPTPSQWDRFGYGTTPPGSYQSPQEYPAPAAGSTLPSGYYGTAQPQSYGQIPETGYGDAPQGYTQQPATEPTQIRPQPRYAPPGQANTTYGNQIPGGVQHFPQPSRQPAFGAPASSITQTHFPQGYATPAPMNKPAGTAAYPGQSPMAPTGPRAGATGYQPSQGMLINGRPPVFRPTEDE
ncbi:MAG: hypothetical protein GY696_17335 [Gammaproteobacteria bacterium]|nr:hypothetical protein [Gammaproteobacteria bacterium]